MAIEIASPAVAPMPERLLTLRAITGPGEPVARERERAEQHAAADREASFSAAYVAHGQAIYAYARRMLANDAEAEDATLASFEKALRAWDRRPVDAELRPWLFRIATNTCLDELRRRKRARLHWQPWDAFMSLFHPSQVAPDDPEADVLRAETGALVRQALDKLAPRDRAALLLREYQGLSTEEIGQALGVSRGAAKVVLFRARERLRSAYLQLDSAPPGRRASHPEPVHTPGASEGQRLRALGDRHA